MMGETMPRGYDDWKLRAPEDEPRRYRPRDEWDDGDERMERARELAWDREEQ